MRSVTQSTCLLFILAALAGCWGGLDKFPVTTVTGRVTCKGEPLAGAQVFFNPLRTGESAIVGKQGFARTLDDGTFTLSTYDEDDGAVVGKHSVRIALPGRVCECVVGDEIEAQQVEIQDGQENHFEIELPIADRKARFTQVRELREESEEEDD